MSINSINHDEISNIAEKWTPVDDTPKTRSDRRVKSAVARRRIEALQEIKESGLTIEEARELGLLH
jgi:ribosomal protein L13E